MPIGLDEENVQPIVLDFTKNRHCLLVGQGQRGKTNMMKLMLHTLSHQKSGFITIFDSFDRGLADFSQEENVTYLETKEQMVEWLTAVEQFYDEVEIEYLAQLQQASRDVKIIPSYFFIDGYSRFLQMVDIGIQDRLSKLMKNIHI